MPAAMTFESVLLSALSLLLAYALYTIKIYISSDTSWKTEMKQYIEEVDAREKACLQKFATKKDYTEQQKKIEAHAIQLARMEQWTHGHEKYHKE